MIRNAIIAAAVASFFAFIFMIFSNIFSMLLMLPGLRSLKKVRDSKIDLVDESLQESLVYHSELSGKVRKDDITDLKEQIALKMQEMGLSENLAQSMSSLRERLEWAPEKWISSVNTVKKLISQGYGEDIVSLYFKLSLEMPTAFKLELLDGMCRAGVRDFDSLKYAMATDYSFEELEKAIEMHEVHGFSWRHAVRKSSKRLQRG